MLTAMNLYQSSMFLISQKLRLPAHHQSLKSFTLADLGNQTSWKKTHYAPSFTASADMRQIALSEQCSENGRPIFFRKAVASIRSGFFPSSKRSVNQRFQCHWNAQERAICNIEEVSTTSCTIWSPQDENDTESISDSPGGSNIRHSK